MLFGMALKQPDNMDLTKFKQYFFAIFQFSALGYIMISGPLFPENPILLAIQMAGVFLGLWAVYVMKFGKFHILPKIVKGSPLVTSGPYRCIRHPMYTSIILFIIPLLANHPDPIRIGLGFLLVVNLFFKLSFEEKLLLREFRQYKTYQNHSYKLLPYII